MQAEQARAPDSEVQMQYQERREQAGSSTSSSKDCSLPRAVVKRIVKSKLSELSEGEKGELQISSDALLAFAESAKIFISYIASTSNDIAGESKRQTISVDDVHRALEDCDFAHDFAEPLMHRLTGRAAKQPAKAKSGPKQAGKADAGAAQKTPSTRGQRKRKGAPAATEVAAADEDRREEERGVQGEGEGAPHGDSAVGDEDEGEGAPHGDSAPGDEGGEDAQPEGEGDAGTEEGEGGDGE